MEELHLRTPDGLSLAAAHHPATDAHRGTVVLAHGITQDMDEGGMFVRLARCLSDAGFDVLRFSFRGHGDSDGTDVGATIAGERLDVQTAVEYATDTFAGPYFVVAKSFGAVSTCLSLERDAERLSGLVLWNPAIDLDATFLDPTAPWGREHFTGEALAALDTQGYLPIGEGFRMGRVLYEELHRYDPAARLAERDVAALVVHGTVDDIVPYEPTRRAAERAGAAFYTIEDADHGFVGSGESLTDENGMREQDRVTVEWLTERTEG